MYGKIIKMKKANIITLFAIPVLLLTGCSANPSTFTSEDKLTAAPTWDLSDSMNSIEDAYAQKTAAPAIGSSETSAPKPSEDVLPSYGSTSQPSTPDPYNPADIPLSPSNSNVYSDSYILINDNATGCKISGQIAYLESYKESYGQEYNSKNYLYNVVSPTSAALTNETKESINGVEFISGSYVQPLSYGERPYHISAVRAFNGSVKIPNATTSTAGPYMSKTDEGVPFVFIDMYCADEKDATKSTWDSLTKIFKLSFGTNK